MYYDDKKDDKLGKVRDPIVKITKWVRSRSLKEKAILAGIGALLVHSLSAIQTATGSRGHVQIALFS